MEEKEKPIARIIGADGNVFNLIGICSKALKKAGYYKESEEMIQRVTSSKSYDEALGIMCEYITPVDQNYEFDEYDDYDINI